MALTLVFFKRFSGDLGVGFNAVSVTPAFLADDDRYTLIDGSRQRKIHFNYQTWNIVFALLAESEQDYLLALNKEPAPQMVLGGTTYDIEIASLNPNAINGGISVINRSAL